MKKVLFIAMAVLAMSACNKMETTSVSDPAEIGFFTMAQNATKGYAVNSSFDQVTNPDTLGHNGSVTVERNWRKMTISAYNATDSKDYFQAKTFEKGTSDEIWHATPAAMYWPIGKSLTFLSYSSKNILSRPEPVAKWDGAKKVSFDITAEQCYQNDILYAQAAGSNRGTAAGKDGSSSTAGLPITFYHSQAWLTFNIVFNGVDAAKQTLDIESIVLENVYNSGVLTFAYDETVGATRPTATWDFFTQNPTDVTVDDAWGVLKKANLVKTSEDVNGVQLNMLMPAQKHNNFVLNYKMNEKSNSVVLPFGTGDFDDVKLVSDGANSAGVKGEWKMGYHYIYNIQISINEITFKPTVTVWTNVTGFNPDPQVI